MRVKIDISVRKATVADVQAIWHVLWTTWAATYGSLIPMEDLESYFGEHSSQRVLGEMFHDPAVRIFVAEADRTVVGAMITKHDKDVERFYVSSLYVLPAFQGFGVGSRLLTEAEDLGRQVKAAALWLGVMDGNTKSVEWYERKGFRFDQRQSFAMGKTRVVHRIGFKTIENPDLG